MANLEQIKILNQQYGKRSPFVNYNVRENLSEAFDPDKIEKAFQDSIANLGPEYSMYFDFGVDADVALLFIDVCEFSMRFGDLTGDEIGEYFDEYYDKIIPIIYKYGGEVDKIIGDGIICEFGPPFQNETLEFNINKANLCAKEIIIATIKTKFASKVAFHCGSVNYFKNKTGLYQEYTIIGKPLTELFRLESISVDNRINYYDDTKIRSFYKDRFSNDPDNVSSQKILWTHYGKVITTLKGVQFDQFFSINYNG